MKSYLKMMLYLIIVAVFIKAFPLLLKHNHTYMEIKNNSEALEIDNSTLFYSEEPKTYIAEQELATRLNGE